MTPNQFIESIFIELLNEKGLTYVEEKCKSYSAKDAQDRYRVKKRLVKLLKKE